MEALKEQCKTIIMQIQKTAKHNHTKQMEVQQNTPLQTVIQQGIDDKMKVDHMNTTINAIKSKESIVFSNFNCKYNNNSETSTISSS